MGDYYENIEHDVEQMKKYYLLGIEKGCDVSRERLKQYFLRIGDLKNAMKYKKPYRPIPHITMPDPVFRDTFLPNIDPWDKKLII
uniref:Uncharacterized protein n=1 Tax=viral metagenome TaxID=1070528 RepID=A0A6C0EE55_9ZZZZ